VRALHDHRPAPAVPVRTGPGQRWPRACEPADRPTGRRPARRKAPPMTRSALFDVDGTLMDTNYPHVTAR
jgi:hypothetical protein